MEQDGGAVAGERDRKGDLKSAAEECLGNTEEEGRESTHTHTCVCVCVCRQLPLCLLPRTVSNRCSLQQPGPAQISEEVGNLSS